MVLRAELERVEELERPQARRAQQLRGLVHLVRKPSGGLLLVDRLARQLEGHVGGDEGERLAVVLEEARLVVGERHLHRLHHLGLRRLGLRRLGRRRRPCRLGCRLGLVSRPCCHLVRPRLLHRRLRLARRHAERDGNAARDERRFSPTAIEGPCRDLAGRGDTDRRSWWQAACHGEGLGANLAVDGVKRRLRKAPAKAGDQGIHLVHAATLQAVDHVTDLAHVVTFNKRGAQTLVERRRLAELEDYPHEIERVGVAGQGGHAEPGHRERNLVRKRLTIRAIM